MGFECLSGTTSYLLQKLRGEALDDEQIAQTRECLKPPDPVHQFPPAGSVNQGKVAAVVLDDWDWYRAQAETELERGLWATEPLSPAYLHLGHLMPDLVAYRLIPPSPERDAVERRLRATWAFLSLLALPARPALYLHDHDHPEGTLTDGPGWYREGPWVTTVGSRANHVGIGGNTLGLILGWALGMRVRVNRSRLEDDPYFEHVLCIEAAYQGQLDGKAPPAGEVGLTEDERNRLKDLVLEDRLDNGLIRQLVGEIPLLDHQVGGLSSSISIRVGRGFRAAWWGTMDTGVSMNRNKPAVASLVAERHRMDVTMPALFKNTGASDSVARWDREGDGEAGEVVAEADQVTVRLPMPPGEATWWLWDAEGLRVLEG